MDTLQTRAIEVLAAATNGPTNLAQVEWLLTNWTALLGSATSEESELSTVELAVYATAIIRISKSAFGDAWASPKQLRGARSRLLGDVVRPDKFASAAKSLRKRAPKQALHRYFGKTKRSTT
ncbi:MAG: hypothetical protein IT355_11355 [Gemmatimonadaceae bacterium]|nr:hypothetical protein [Gemmatimonadaceae bacterium]